MKQLQLIFILLISSNIFANSLCMKGFQFSYINSFKYACVMDLNGLLPNSSTTELFCDGVDDNMAIRWINDTETSNYKCPKGLIRDSNQLNDETFHDYCILKFDDIIENLSNDQTIKITCNRLININIFSYEVEIH